MKKILTVIMILAISVASLFGADDEIRRLPTENKGLEKPLLLDNMFPYILATQEDILEWVDEKIIYKSDFDTWGVQDYWQTPEETLILRTGDCEDFTILAMALLRLAGIYSELVLCDVADGMNGSEWEDELDRDYGGHAMLWIYESVDQNVDSMDEWRHDLGYYEPQTGRKVIYQYTFHGHLPYDYVMHVAYNMKSLNPDKFRIPE